jgi:hypothetical protein
MYMDKKGRQGNSGSTEESGSRESPFNRVDEGTVERNKTVKKERALTSSKKFEEYKELVLSWAEFGESTSALFLPFLLGDPHVFFVCDLSRQVVSTCLKNGPGFVR